MATIKIGNATVEKLVDWTGPLIQTEEFFPTGNWDDIEAERSWMEPHFLAPKGKGQEGALDLSLHTYIIKVGGLTVLIDTCVGNDKKRTLIPDWVDYNSDYMEKMAGMGVNPEDVDFVMCTHLHIDHVGWNTKLKNGKWVPTFPNARYIFHKKEYEAWETLDHPADDGSYQDSVVPIVEAGRADLVHSDHAINDNLWLEPSFGHTPGHVSVNLKDGSDSALFTGDCFHHPIQVARPEWSSGFCLDAEASANTRQKIIDKIADTSTLMMAAHFMDPTVGRVVGNGDRCKLDVNI
jgi:glyoxylase-like metal-dependent hydrolase (beta-lactamase superfamily II)